MLRLKTDERRSLTSLRTSPFGLSRIPHRSGTKGLVLGELCLNTSGGVPESDSYIGTSSGLVLKSPRTKGELKREIQVLRVELRKAVEHRERALEEAAASRVELLEETYSLRTKVEQYEQLCFSVDQVMEHFSSPQAVLDASSPGKVTGHNERLLSLFVDNVILKAQVAVQQESLQKLSGCQSPHHASSSGVSLSSASSESVSLSAPQSSSSVAEALTHTPHSPPIPSLSSSSSATHQSQAVQTDPLIATEEVRKEVHPDLLQQKLETVSLSNDLLSASLEGARKHISSLEATVTSLNEELVSKEAQITTVSGRIASLLKSFESSQSDSLQYKTLYYRSVERCNSLQTQIENYRQLLPKLDHATQHKITAAAQLAENKALLRKWQSELVARQEDCQMKLRELEKTTAQLKTTTEECQMLRGCNDSQRHYCAELQRQLAHQLAHSSVFSALRRLHEEEVTELNISLKAQRAEVVSLKARMVQVMDAFQRSREEYNENTEFTETERMMLLEANVDLETQVDTLKSSLEEKEQLLKDAKQQLQRSRTKVAEMEKRVKQAHREADQLAAQHTWEVSELHQCLVHGCSALHELLSSLELHATEEMGHNPPLSPPPTSAADVEQTREYFSTVISRLTSAALSSQHQAGKPAQSRVELINHSAHSCPGCTQLQSQLVEALGMLNDRGALQYGDLMQEKFSLERQVRELSSELEKGEEEFHKLSQYIKDYQSKTSEKVDILKSNLAKADGEIEELDRLLEHTRKTLQDSRPHLASCSPLLELLQELEGGESVSISHSQT